VQFDLFLKIQQEEYGTEEGEILHINSKELLAAWLSLSCYASNMRNSHIHLRIDNTTVVAHINKMGGMNSGHLWQLAIKVWNWCLDRCITISAEHLPRSLNQLVATDSRAQAESSDWALDLTIFQQMMVKRRPCTMVPTIGETSKILQLEVRPGSDSGRYSVPNLEYGERVCLSTFCLIGRCLAKIKSEKVPRMLLISPLWKLQASFPLLPEMSVEKPILLPSSKRLLTNRMGVSHPMVIQGHLQLVAWTVSRVLSRIEDFQRKLLHSSVLHGVSTPKPHTLVVGGFG